MNFIYLIYNLSKLFTLRYAGYRWVVNKINVKASGDEVQDLKANRGL